MKKTMLAKDVYWVGAIDFNLRSFHHYSTSPKGSTYNAYFVDDEKKCLIDTVSHEYYETLVAHLDEHLENQKLDYIICQHFERDHSGTLPQIMERYKPDVLYCSKLGLLSLKGQFDTEGWNIQAVADGETISLGKKKVTFYETRMLHWPDSMITHLQGSEGCDHCNILFTNDIFGQNIACAERFIDNYDRGVLYSELKRYYANIILPYSAIVLKALEKVVTTIGEVDMLAPDHGLIFRTKEDIDFVYKAYTEFATQSFKKSAVIAYDSMWYATERMAQIIGEVLYEEDIPYVLVDVQKNHVAEIMTYLMDASIILLGSSTRNNLPMTSMAALVNHLMGLAPKNRYGAAFGSYGWSGEAPKLLTESLEKMKVEILSEPLRIQYGVNKEQEAECRKFAKELADKINAIS